MPLRKKRPYLKYSGPHFSAFGMSTNQKNSEYRHFSRSMLKKFCSNLVLRLPKLNFWFENVNILQIFIVFSENVPYFWAKKRHCLHDDLKFLVANKKPFLKFYVTFFISKMLFIMSGVNPLFDFVQFCSKYLQISLRDSHWHVFIKSFFKCQLLVVINKS